MRLARHRTGPAALAAFALVLAACGGGGDDSGDTTVAPTSAAATETTATATAAGQVSSLESMKGAVVQILAEGEIREPEGSQGFQGSGSGFLISPEGLIVTNNHVVTGAGSLTVMIGGETGTRYPARLLGVSECSDLAVIELIDKGTYPYMAWSTAPVEPPLEIYAAGFPLGDPEYTITRGVVSKAKAAGDTSWASIRHVIEHDANIQPGNSGGPLVDKNGAVVGINYAGGDPGTGTSQFRAIAQDIAKPLIDELKTGNKETVGVNGRAFVDREAGVSGIWVRGVTAGGPAANAGVKPGDVLTTLNGVDLSGGTMAPYCRVLRSSQPKQAMSLRLIRFDTKEVLEGELNGKPLAAVFSFAEQLKDDVPTGGGSATPSSGQFVKLTDSSGKISIEAPKEWNDVSLEPQDLMGLGSKQPTIIAAPDSAKFQNSNGPGLTLVLAELAGAGAVDKDELLKGLESSTPECKDFKYNDYKDNRYVGRYLTAQCDGTLGVVAVVSPPGDTDRLLLLVAQAASEGDLVAIDKALSTFEIL